MLRGRVPGVTNHPPGPSLSPKVGDKRSIEGHVAANRPIEEVARRTWRENRRWEPDLYLQNPLDFNFGGSAMVPPFSYFDDGMYFDGSLAVRRAPDVHEEEDVWFGARSTEDDIVSTGSSEEESHECCSESVQSRDYVSQEEERPEPGLGGIKELIYTWRGRRKQITRRGANLRVKWKKKKTGRVTVRGGTPQKPMDARLIRMTLECCAASWGARYSWRMNLWGDHPT
eukprot:NODE_274_length_1061_cov_212.944664_g233_i0.p1 GENE.NODE_274_length_1061_cov_212.944664_g233_i0~~NODE_274_length_1061_cov_212.944664_g233_i0.p1  ORF type:complete len:228 (-),score=53.79 NODE_274_length_1061_cov_212.944664_g233_i0:301-984(-)